MVQKNDKRIKTRKKACLEAFIFYPHLTLLVKKTLFLFIIRQSLPKIKSYSFLDKKISFKKSIKFNYFFGKINTKNELLNIYIYSSKKI